MLKSLRDRNKYVVGNWKSNKTAADITLFFNSFQKLGSKLEVLNTSVVPVVCPSFVHLDLSSQLVEKLKLQLYLGAQDISPFDRGAYTGEPNGEQLKEYVSFVIIGHSERRKYFAETDTLLKLKVEQAKKWGINTIYCVPDDVTDIPGDVNIVAYEPVFAIGTGKPDSPENANKVIKSIKKKTSVPVIYGGSVTAENIRDFVMMDAIDGVLPGKASLDADHFYQMIINAAV